MPGLRTWVGWVGAAIVMIACGTAPAQSPLEGPPAPASREAQALGAPGKMAAGRKAGATSEPVKTPGWIKGTAVPLAGVLALVVVGGRLLRSAAQRCGGLRSALGVGGKAPSGIMEILGRYPVGRGTSLVLLKLDSRILLLSQSAGGRFGAGANFTTLAEITEPEQVASILIKSRDEEGDSLSEKFRAMLQRFDRQMEPEPASAAIWDGTRSDIPVIDLTQRESRPGTRRVRGRLSARRAGDGAVA